jgi:hypothetical protein
MLLCQDEILIDKYKDKKGFLIIFYINSSGNKELDIDPIYRKNNKHSERQLELCYKKYGNRYMLRLSEKSNILSACILYCDCLWSLRYNKQLGDGLEKRHIVCYFREKVF